MSGEMVGRTGAAAKRPRRRVDGILLVDKPSGPSSNQVLQWVKRLFHAEKAGHTGTLDPFASGLLPVMFGEATKYSSFFLDASKTYEATVALGVTTTTGDITGDVLERRLVSVSESEIRTAVSSFMGEQMQTPPMHSALKRNGVPLYELARRGEVVAREPRRIVIEAIDVIRVEGPECAIRVRCSKGTYVRVLAEDLGNALGCGASLSALRRTAVSSFSVRESSSSEQLESCDFDGLTSRLLSIDAGLEHVPRIDLDSGAVERLRFGQSVPYGEGGGGDLPAVRVYQIDSNRFIGLARLQDGSLFPVRLVVL